MKISHGLFIYLFIIIIFFFFGGGGFLLQYASDKS